MNEISTSVKVGDSVIELQTGKLAEQATAAVVAKSGDNVVLATVVMGQENTDLDYFPLYVEHQERLYAGGIIKGSRWVKREGRPTDDSILTARVIDRSIRPLFPKDFKREVQIVITPLSVDGQNPVDILSLYAVSAALAISPIPWEGPVGGIRLGLSESGDMIINPSFEELETSKLDLITSATKDAIVMVESGSNEVSEQTMLDAFQKSQEIISTSIQGIEEFIKKAGQPKVDYVASHPDSELVALLTKETKADIKAAIKGIVNLDKSIHQALLDKLFDSYAETYSKKDIAGIVSDLIKAEARRQTLAGTRPDGRKYDEIRSIWCQVGVLPRTHGSGIFTRGATQALTIATLGSPAMEQLIEGAEGEKTKRYIHHYNMPPYTVGEVGRMGWPSRREVGHGALAERALIPVLPSEEEFPYTIRVVSELMSSNGSTSQASVCGSTLSLMDAGVPIKKPVAGIAMGLITDGKKHVILSDIMGFEDHTGDMDFKVAGTKDGINAMQMDIKVKGIPYEVLQEALEQARVGRLYILDKMLATIAEPKKSLSPYAPKIVTTSVPVDRIGEIIGPGGKIIKNIIAESGAQVDVDDDGKVFISGTEETAIQKAKDMVEGIVREVEAGEEFDGTVARIVDFGIFVNILPGKDGLVHVSHMSSGHVGHPSDMVKEGDPVHVRVREIDSMGRINLTMLTPEEEAQVKSQPRRPNHHNNNHGRRDFSTRRPRRDHR